MIDEDTGSGDMCMVYEIQARSELGHDRLGREAVADRGRRRARGRVEAQHGAARAGDFGVGGVARHERAQRRRAVGEGVDDRRQDAAKMGVHVRAVVGAAVLHQGAPLVLRIVGHEPQGVEVGSTDEDLEGQHARAPDVGRRAVVALGVEHLRREEAQAPRDALPV